MALFHASVWLNKTIVQCLGGGRLCCIGDRTTFCMSALPPCTRPLLLFLLPCLFLASWWCSFLCLTSPKECWYYRCCSHLPFLWAPELDSGQACVARAFTPRTILLALQCIFLTHLSKVSGCSSESYQCLLFCGIGLCVCFCARATLFSLPRLCGIIWDRVLW